MQNETLVVPGFHGSGEAHWQSWLERRDAGARRVRGIDWEQPVLSEWAAAIVRELDQSPSQQWIVAHSFGCLASAVAVAARPGRVAGLMLVAPADPERFSPRGVRRAEHACQLHSVASLLPQGQLLVPSLLVASSDDPWMRLVDASALARRWGSRFLNIGAAGHINAASGYGPWPEGLELLHGLQAFHAPGVNLRRAV